MLALREATVRALEAAFFKDEHAGAVRTLAGHILTAVIFGFWLAIYPCYLFLQYRTNGISAGENGLSFFPGYRWASDASQLFDN